MMAFHDQRGWEPSAWGMVLYGVLCVLAGAVVASFALTRVQAGSPFTDNFDRVNSETVGNNWSDTTTDNWDIASNTLRHDSAAYTELFNTKNISTEWEEYIFHTNRPAIADCFFAFRYALVGGTLKFYQVGISSTEYKLYKYDAGAFTLLVEKPSAPGTGQAWWRVVVQGHHIYWWSSTQASTTPIADLKWTLHIEHFDPARTALTGKFGFRTSTNGLLIDNFHFREPGITLKNAALDTVLGGVTGTFDEFARANSEQVGGVFVDDATNTWLIENGVLKNDVATGGSQIVTDATTDSKDQLVGMKYAFGATSGTINVMLRYVTSPSVAFYQISIPYSGNILVYRYTAAGGFVLMQTGISVSHSTANAYLLQASVTGAVIRVMHAQDGKLWTLVAEVTDTANVSTRGVTGFRDCPVFWAFTWHVLPYTHVSPELHRPNLYPDGSGPDIANNLYAPDIVSFNGLWRQYFGSYGDDNKDRIMMRTSTDSRTWSAPTTVLNPGVDGTWDDIHVNDPSVVVSGGTLYLYYTGAGDCTSGCIDDIGLATSTDGSTFTKHASNPVVVNGGAGTWNERLVGRPSALIDGSIWRMWADGQTAAGVSKLGLWTSSDGVSWTAFADNPIYGPSFPVAAVHVVKYGSTYHLFNQGVTDGTHYAVGTTPTAFTTKFPILPPTWETEYAAGQVTPQFFQIGSSQRLYVGQAKTVTQDTQRMVLYQFYKKLEVLAGTKNLAHWSLAVNDTDVKVALSDVGSVTLNLYTDFAGTTLSQTLSLSDLNWGDVLQGGAGFPVPYLWWQQQRALDVRGGPL